MGVHDLNFIWRTWHAPRVQSPRDAHERRQILFAQVMCRLREAWVQWRCGPKVREAALLRAAQHDKVPT